MKDINYTKKCRVCGKTFSPLLPDEWAYRTKDSPVKWYCSWGCLRKDEKRRKNRFSLHNNGPETVGIDRTTLAYLIRESGKNMFDIALEMGRGKEYLYSVMHDGERRMRKAYAERLAEVLDCDLALIVREDA